MFLVFFWLQWIFTAAHRLFAACGEQVLLSRGGAWASHCSSFWLWSTDSRTRRLQQLRHMGSVIEACKLECVVVVAVDQGFTCLVA